MLFASKMAQMSEICPKIEDISLIMPHLGQYLATFEIEIEIIGILLFWVGFGLVADKRPVILIID